MKKNHDYFKLKRVIFPLNNLKLKAMGVLAKWKDSWLF